MLEHHTSDTDGERERETMATSMFKQQVEGGRYQFVVQDTLQKSSPISENNEEESLRLLPQVVDPPTNLHPLTTVLFTVSNLNLVKNKGDIGEGKVGNTPTVRVLVSTPGNWFQEECYNYSTLVTRTQRAI